MSKVLIADSGSTKTDWMLGSTVIRTQGINPVMRDDDDILAILKSVRVELMSAGEDVHSVEPLSAIRYYGSGVRPDQEQRMASLLRTVFPEAAVIEARSDMVGAARALCGHRPGLAAILGTGSNSCLFDGNDIVANIPPLGYVLGDEGSGAVMGRMFFNALYKNRLYEGAVEEFEQHFGLSQTEVINRVYRQPLANRWLASLSPYIHQHIGEPTVAAIVRQNLRDFITHNIVPYHRPDLPLSAVGSIACYYRDLLEDAAAAEGYRLGTVEQSPLQGMMRWEK